MCITGKLSQKTLLPTASIVNMRSKDGDSAMCKLRWVLILKG